MPDPIPSRFPSTYSRTSVLIDTIFSNLPDHAARPRGWGLAILQTYYSMDQERMVGAEAGRARQFAGYMRIVREVAKDKGVPLADHMVRWEPLRKADLETYRKCMRDPLHLSPLGHQVLGLEELRFFESGLDKNLKEAAKPAYSIQAELDRLGQQEGPRSAATAPAL